MKILKATSFIIYLCVVKSECGLIDNIFGTIKNTTKALKTDMHNFVAYGNDVVFGDKDFIKNCDQVPQEHKAEGLLTGILHKAKTTVSDFNQKVKNILHISKNGGEKTINTVDNELNNIQNEITDYAIQKPDDENGLITNDPEETRDNVIKYILRNNADVLKRLNISEVDIQNLFDGNKDTMKSELVMPTGDQINGDGLIDVRALDV